MATDTARHLVSAHRDWVTVRLPCPVACSHEAPRDPRPSRLSRWHGDVSGLALLLCPSITSPFERRERETEGLVWDSHPQRAYVRIPMRGRGEEDAGGVCFVWPFRGHRGRRTRTRAAFIPCHRFNSPVPPPQTTNRTQAPARAYKNASSRTSRPIGLSHLPYVLPRSPIQR